MMTLRRRFLLGDLEQEVKSRTSHRKMMTLRRFLLGAIVLFTLLSSLAEMTTTRCASSVPSDVPAGCAVLGHKAPDVDSVASSLVAAYLFKGVAILPVGPNYNPPSAEIRYVLNHAVSVASSRGGADVEGTSTSSSTATDEDETSSSTATDEETDMRTLISKLGVSTVLVDEELGNEVERIGVVSSDSTKFPTTSCAIQVDHNADAQTLSYRVRGSTSTTRTAAVVDHHMIDASLSTKSPILADFRPWGSTSTILWDRWYSSSTRGGAEKPFLPTSLAVLLLAGVLSDTVNLSSPTTTEADRVAVPQLRDHIVGKSGPADVQELGLASSTSPLYFFTDPTIFFEGMASAKDSELAALPFAELSRRDSKLFPLKSADGSCDIRIGVAEFLSVDTLWNTVKKFRTTSPPAAAEASNIEINAAEFFFFVSVNPQNKFALLFDNQIARDKETTTWRRTVIQSVYEGKFQIDEMMMDYVILPNITSRKKQMTQIVDFIDKNYAQFASEMNCSPTRSDDL
ncbi:unnamed protein product [Amoebophrya sp. A25]|nr:unnamed protein product [Amoebophrya sp. A25]|eukprot:GSA25T00009589001.1